MSDFTFPKNKTIVGKQLRLFEFQNGKFNYSMIDISDPKDNQINIEGTDYFFRPLNERGGNKGGNSIILKLYESQNINVSDLNYGTPDLILKISRYRKSQKKFQVTKSEKRFNQEVKALKEIKKSKFPNVVELFHFGTCKIFNSRKNKFDNHLYYTMEYASNDLKDYIE